MPLGSQQPLGHDVASQTHWPLLRSHSWPVAQDAHVAPPVPQDVGDSLPYASHDPLVPPLQHPFAQVLLSH